MPLYLTGTTYWPSTRDSAVRTLNANGYKSDDEIEFTNENGELARITGEKPSVRIDYLSRKPTQPGQAEYSPFGPFATFDEPTRSEHTLTIAEVMAARKRKKA